MAEVCTQCQRETRRDQVARTSHKPVVAVYIVHGFYGCDTGCCGHEKFAVDEDGRVVHEDWRFKHPYGIDKDEWAKSELYRWPDANVESPIDLSRCAVMDD